ncbi:T9SS type A sorting domain-containing protein [Flavobacterium amnicola]|uniref:T9SS type A sorting domain-containing protein n=1 Tax=Flavobacterium amnicola TaxID=2506422 RepID=A0A4V1N290_9FLAO|nr:M4 family metallopeptidase [Flavobacterium amnicola]RXR20891.1 T9SS type A sorting domain-containing protein [Flavobacterium amnicola]
MKNQFRSIGTLAALSLFTLSSFAQELDRNVNKKEKNANGTPSFVSFKENSDYKSADFQTIFKEQLGLKQNQNFSKIKTDSDELGFTHEKFQLFHQGIKVEFATYSLHSKNGKVATMTGEFYTIENVNTNPSISAEVALQNAMRKIGAQKYLWENPSDAAAMNYVKPQGELVLLPTEKGVKLAYKFDMYAAIPVSRGDLYIDAVTGDSLFYNATIKHLGEHSHGKGLVGNAHADDVKSFASLVAANAATRYSGTQNIETTLSGSSYILSDATRGNGIQTFNCNKTATYPSTNFTDADNNWTAAEFNNTNKDNGALDGHWGAEKTYDYFKNVHARNSFNNAGAAIKSYIHYNLVAAGYPDNNNAFWNGSVMTYGDGSGTGGFDILTSLDVAAHEIGHAVCTNTANLTYSNESGAMNEGFSDIWAACVEYYAAPTKQTWLIGEDIERRSGHVSLRSMSNPNAEGQPDTYKGTSWYTGTGDNGGVHYNSGVLNHWFYILSVGKSGTNDIGNAFNVTGITIDKAAKIAYRLEANYLSANSNYANARTGGIQAAIDLYGAGSPEVIATTNAFYAVGIGAAYSGGTSDTTAPSTPASLTASGTTSSSTNLAWTAATDNVGVTGYNVYSGTTLLGTATGTTYTASGLTASTTYSFTVKAKDAAGNLSASSNAVSVTTLAAVATYCASKGNSVADEYIGRVQIGTINNASTGGTGYSDYTSISTNVTKGSATTITVTPTWTGTTYAEGYAVWIDLNNDKDFADTGELVWSKAAATATPATGSFTVPTTAITGATRMRVSMKYNGIPTACEAIAYGEVEDYTVNLVAGSADTTAPTAPTALTASGTTTTTTNLSWTAATDNVGVTGYDVYQGTTLKGSVTGTTYAVTGLTAATAYTFSVKAKDAAGNVSASSNVVNVTTSASTVTYCASKGNSVADEFIDYVALRNVANTTGANAGYGNFTSLVANLPYGSNTITYSAGFTGSAYTEFWSVWIDYNKNGTFETTEQVVSGSSSSSANLSTTFTVPTTALAGTTRMRVSMKYNAAPTACETFSYGEVEDYTVNIGAAAVNAIAATGSELTNENNIYDFEMYPNPVESTLSISMMDNRDVSFKIYNLMGQIVKANQLNQSEINVSDMASGLYIFEINDGQKTITKKFIKK